MKKNKLSLRRLFSNTKFLIAFSIVVAFVFWIVVALQYAPIVENTIEDVPVMIDLENSVPDKMGLQIFGQKDFKVDITVSGNRYIVGGDLLKADDFDVIAQTAYVSSAGNHMLQLKVTPKDPESSYEITGLSADYIEVYFDKFDEKDIPVEPRIITELQKLTDSDYLFNEKELIVNTKTVHIAGAKTEIDRIEKGYIDIKIENRLKESLSEDAQITLDNGTNDDVKYVTVNGAEMLKVPVTLPVYKIETLPSTVSFKNAPSDYVNNPPTVSVFPSSVKVAVLCNGGEDAENISVGTVDFNNLSPVNSSFSFEAADIENVKILDGTKGFSVRVNMDGFTSYQFDIDSSNIFFSNKQDNTGAAADVSSTGKITVVGKSEDIEKILAEDIIGTVDYDLSTIKGKSAELPMAVTIKNSNGCWVSGEYKVKVNIK